MACIWLALGYMESCSDPSTSCIQSWIYANGFDKVNTTSQYIFAFYWIFEVITTVGYGDDTGAT